MHAVKPHRHHYRWTGALVSEQDELVSMLLSMPLKNVSSYCAFGETCDLIATTHPTLFASTFEHPSFQDFVKDVATILIDVRSVRGELTLERHLNLCLGLFFRVLRRVDDDAGG